MWKNTDGVYTADPRRVPDAFSIKSLKYDEAMELAYFGAQVLHPSAMIPCIENNIPVYVRNIFNPEFEGTIIQGRSTSLKSRMEGWSTETEGSLSDEGEIPIEGLTALIRWPWLRSRALPWPLAVSSALERHVER